MVKTFDVKEFMEGHYNELMEMKFVKDIRLEAKKEVFDDIERLAYDDFGIDSKDYDKLKIKHLTNNSNKVNKESD